MTMTKTSIRVRTKIAKWVSNFDYQSWRKLGACDGIHMLLKGFDGKPGLFTALNLNAKYQFREHSFFGTGIDVRRCPSVLTINFGSKERANDFLIALGYELPYDRSYSKYVDKMYLEDSGKTLVVLG